MKYLITALVICFCLLKWIFPSTVEGLSWRTINTTIKISICGNDVKEGGEDCDNADLDGKTCDDLGFAGGDLSCDFACDFDTSLCISPTPTLTPTPTSTPTITPTPTSTPTPTLTPSPAVTSTPVPDPTSTSGPVATSTPDPAATMAPQAEKLKSILPVVVANYFDPDGDGIIVATEVFTAVKTWVEEWKGFLKEAFAVETIVEEVSGGEKIKEETRVADVKKCDINHDRVCNLLDLSILLFYVGRTAE